MRLVRGFLTVGFWTGISRIFGFLRDIAIAATLGAGPVAEAFLVGFSLPNMFRRIFAEGAFNTAFVPMFTRKLTDKNEAQAFARDTMSLLVGILCVLSVIAMVGMPWLVMAMASGFAGDERFDLAVLFGRITFPYILFISVTAMLSGILNATHRFVAAAAAPVLLNVVFLGAIACAVWLRWDIGLALAWAVPVAGLGQLVIVWNAARRAGYRLIPRWPVWTPELARLLKIAAPAALAGGVVQVNLLVGRQVGSFFDGALAWLSYADRLYQLPLGVVGIAVGIVLLPGLAHQLQAGDEEAGQNAFSRAVEFSLALTIPAAVALAVIPVPLVSVLFERGAFDAASTVPTALAVSVYGIGLPAFVLQKTYQPLFFARGDTKRPFQFALVAMIINAVVAIGLAQWVGFIAAAIATSLSGWAMLALLYGKSRSMGRAATLDHVAWRRVPRITLAACVMGVVLWGLQSVLSTALVTPTVRYGALALLILGGVAAYIGAARVVGAFRFAEVRAAVRRGA